MAKTPERKGKPKSNPSTPKKTMGQKAAHEAWDWFKAFLYAAVAVVMLAGACGGTKKEGALPAGRSNAVRFEIP